MMHGGLIAETATVLDDSRWQPNLQSQSATNTDVLLHIEDLNMQPFSLLW